MVRKEKSQDYFFRVCLSDQETIVLSNNHEDAASLGVTNILKKYKKNTNLSLCVVVDKINEDSFETELFDVSYVLENIGYFSLSKKISELSDFLLDKAKNSS